MMLAFSGSTKHGRIVVHYAGPCCWMWCLKVPTNCLVAEAPIYCRDIVPNVARFSSELILDGYIVEPGYSIDDNREIIWKMMRS
jgi:hypothetical protein